MCSCSFTTMQPRLACLSPCAHTLMQAAVCCLHDVLRTYPGAACAAAPLRRRSLDWLACLRVRIHSYEQLCAVSMMCCVHIWDACVLFLTITLPGASWLSACERTRVRAAACLFLAPCGHVPAHTRIRAALRCPPRVPRTCCPSYQISDAWCSLPSRCCVWCDRTFTQMPDCVQ